MVHLTPPTEALIHGGRARVDGMAHVFRDRLLESYRRVVAVWLKVCPSTTT
jgi:hypothetical protein